MRFQKIKEIYEFKEGVNHCEVTVFINQNKSYEIYRIHVQSEEFIENVINQLKYMKLI